MSRKLNDIDEKEVVKNMMVNEGVNGGRIG